VYGSAKQYSYELRRTKQAHLDTCCNAGLAACLSLIVNRSHVPMMSPEMISSQNS
jgi:hypothetical protein